MKARISRRPSKTGRSRAGRGGSKARAQAGRKSAGSPLPGWPTIHSRLGEYLVNPRPPSVPSTLDLRLNEYYAGAIVMGLMATADFEPERAWIRKWSFDFGAEMAAEALRRRKRRA